jgi:hypothetical protein
MTNDDLGPREAEAIKKLLDLAKFAMVCCLLAGGYLGVDSLGLV